LLQWAIAVDAKYRLYILKFATKVYLNRPDNGFLSEQ